MASNSAPSALATRVVKASDAAIDAGARLLAAGELVAFPTETVYGLGADARNGEAVARLYRAKGRPSFNPLIAHVASLDAAARIGRMDAAATELAATFWPGPLTLVLPKAAECRVSDLATAGLDTIAVRIPDHPVARALLRRFGNPVVAPSANRSGHVSPTTAAHVAADLNGRIALVIDGGQTPVGVESTIVACLGARPALLRPGGAPREAIERALGFALADAPADAHPRDDGAVLAPGMLASHYAPRATLRLDAAEVRPGEALLAFGPHPAGRADRASVALNLSERGDLVEAAANLFSYLRALDATGVASVAVTPIPHEGLGEAINDRLARAAAPRPN